MCKNIRYLPDNKVLQLQKTFNATILDKIGCDIFLHKYEVCLLLAVTVTAFLDLHCVNYTISTDSL